MKFDESVIMGAAPPPAIVRLGFLPSAHFGILLIAVIVRATALQELGGTKSEKPNTSSPYRSEQESQVSIRGRDH